MRFKKIKLPKSKITKLQEELKEIKDEIYEGEKKESNSYWGDCFFNAFYSRPSKGLRERMKTLENTVEDLLDYLKLEVSHTPSHEDIVKKKKKKK